MRFLCCEWTKHCTADRYERRFLASMPSIGMDKCATCYRWPFPTITASHMSRSSRFSTDVSDCESIMSLSLWFRRSKCKATSAKNSSRPREMFTKAPVILRKISCSMLSGSRWASNDLLPWVRKVYPCSCGWLLLPHQHIMCGAFCLSQWNIVLFVEASVYI